MNAVTQKLFIEGGTKALDFLALESRRTIMPETCKFAGWKRWNWFFFFFPEGNYFCQFLGIQWVFSEILLNVTLAPPKQETSLLFFFK